MKGIIIPILLFIAWAIFRLFFAQRFWGYIFSLLGWAYREKIRPEGKWGLIIDYLFLMLWVLLWVKLLLWSWPIHGTRDILASFLVLVLGVILWLYVTGRAY
jgi:hypothetical protein